MFFPLSRRRCSQALTVSVKETFAFHLLVITHNNPPFLCPAVTHFAEPCCSFLFDTATVFFLCLQRGFARALAFLSLFTQPVFFIASTRYRRLALLFSSSGTLTVFFGLHAFRGAFAFCPLHANRLYLRLHAFAGLCVFWYWCLMIYYSSLDFP